jgi:hypothetical protein
MSAYQVARHGTANTYKNLGCRCNRCSEAARLDARSARHARYARRLLIDGVWIAPVADDRHGLPYTYNSWGCRCEPCTDAAAADRRRLAKNRAARRGTRVTP